jgi:hypothetical protein
VQGVKFWSSKIHNKKSAELAINFDGEKQVKNEPV